MPSTPLAKDESASSLFPASIRVFFTRVGTPPFIRMLMRRHVLRWIEVAIVTIAVIVIIQSRTSKMIPKPNLALDKILLFGDSITQHSFNPEIHGWGATLAHAYMRKLEVVNRGFSGFNTEWCKTILSATLLSLKQDASHIRIATLFLGANDAALPTANPHAHVPLDRYSQNLVDMLTIFRNESPGTRVIVITPPPVDPTVWGNKCLAKGKTPDRSVEHTKLYRDACLASAKKVKEQWADGTLAIVDSWEAFFGPDKTNYLAGDVKDLLSDGLHLASEGNQKLAALILKTVVQSWPELDPESEGLKRRVIEHDKIDKSKLPDCLFANAL